MSTIKEFGETIPGPGAAKKVLKNFKLELWPGYVTSIRQDDHNNIQLSCKVSAKVRTDTALDQLKECHKKDSKNVKTNATEMLLGSIVIAKHNNKTYRIAEICWNKTPNDTFELEDGSTMSFKTYYEDKSDCIISDDQPLLMSQPKMKEGPVYLIPELCNMTGLSEEQRANFQLTKDTEEYKDKRDEIKRILSDWNLQFTKEHKRLEKENAQMKK